MKPKINEKDFKDIVKKSKSTADICRELHIVPNGGNYKTIKTKLILWNVDTSHFTGKGWNTGERFTPFGKKISLEDIMIENSLYTSIHNLKKKLFQSGLKVKKCEKCGITEWMGEDLSLELHHINGNNLDHRLENLIILCPNCHSQTESHKGKNKKPINNLITKKEKSSRKKEKTQFCCECGKKIKRDSKYCVKCNGLHHRNSKRPDNETLLSDIRTLGYVGTGKKYGVTDNAIRKWIK